jgi:hypothetical protein
LIKVQLNQANIR